MKSFEEVKAELGEDFDDCLMLTEEFLEDWEDGAVSSYDGVGALHDGEKFVTNEFETDIFDFIRKAAPTITKEDFIKKYPYVAWYNK